MADDLTTVLRFIGDAQSAEATINNLIASLQRAGEVSKQAFNPSAAQASTVALDQLSASTIRVAAATQQTAQAIVTETQASIRATTSTAQFTGANTELVAVSSKAEKAMLAQAQAIARLQQISGNTPAAIKTLGDALAKVSDRSALPALRAELQKTYLDTNYANSPLISAIRGINTGNGLLNTGLQQVSKSFGQASGAAKQFIGELSAAGAGENSIAGLASAAGALGGALGLLTGGLILAAAGGIAALAEHAATADEKIFDLSIKTNFASETLAAFGIAARTSGVSIDDVSGFLVKFQRNLGEAVGGNKQLAATFAQLGIDIKKGLQDPQAAFDTFLKKFNQLSDDAGKIDLVQKLGGRGGAALLQFLKEGGDGIDGFLKKAKELGIALPSAFDAGAADKFNDSIANIEDQFSGLATTVGRELLPVLQPLLEGVSQALADLAPNAESFGQSLTSGLQDGIDDGKALLILLGSIRDLAADLIRIVDDGSGTTSENIRENARELGLIQGLLLHLADGIALIEDVARLSLDVIVGAIKGTALFALSATQGVLDFFGIASSAIEKQIKRLGSEFAELNADFDLGLRKTREIGREIENARNQNEARALGFAQTETGPDGRVIPKGSANVNRLSLPSRGAERFTPEGRGGAAGGKDSTLDSLKQIGEAELKLKQINEKAAEQLFKLETENLKIALNERFISLEEFTNRSIDLDNRQRESKIAVLNAEADDVQKNFAKQEAEAERVTKNANQRALKVQALKVQEAVKLGEIGLKLSQAQQDSDLRQQSLRDANRLAEEKAELDHQNRLVGIREIGRKSLEAAIRAQASIGTEGLVAAEQKIADIERQGFADRESLLRRDLELSRANEQDKIRINDELAKLAAERAAFEQDASEKIRAAQKREADEFAALVKARVASVQELQKVNQAATAAILQLNLQTGAVGKNDAQLQQIGLQREALKLETSQRQEAITQQNLLLQEQARVAGASKAAILEIEKNGNAQIEAEQARSNAELDRLANEEFGFQQSIAGGVSGLFSQRVNELSQNLGLAKATIQAFSEDLQASITPLDEIGSKAFEGFAAGIGSIVQQFVLMGTTGPAALRKLLAATLATIAAEAAVNAIKQLALGFAALFLNPPEAAAHFTSAALWGSLALGSAIVGRAIAPSASSGGAAGGSTGATSSTSNDPRVIDQGGPLPNRNGGPQVIVIRTEVGEGTVVKHWMEDVRNNGQTRNTVQQLAAASS